MTTKDSIISIISIKVIMAAVTLAGTVLDPEVLQCSTGPLPICNYMQTHNLFWATLPMCACCGLVIFVTIYVVKTIIHQQAAVAPVINLPSSSSSRQEAATDTSATEFELGYKTLDEPGVETRRVENKILRKNDDPNMFFRVTTTPPLTPQPQCLPISNQHLVTARRHVIV